MDESVKAMMPAGYESQIFFLPTSNTRNANNTEIVRLDDATITDAFDRIDIVWNKALFVPYTLNARGQYEPKFIQNYFELSSQAKQKLIEKYNDVMNAADVVVPLVLSNQTEQPIDFKKTVLEILKSTDLQYYPNLPNSNAFNNEADYVRAIYQFFFDEDAVSRNKEINSKFLAAKSMLQVIFDYYQKLNPRQNLATSNFGSNIASIFSAANSLPKFNKLPISKEVELLEIKTHNNQQAAQTILNHLKKVIPQLLPQKNIFKNFVGQKTASGTVSLSVTEYPYDKLQLDFTDVEYAKRFHAALIAYNFSPEYIDPASIKLDFAELTRFLTVVCGLYYNHAKILFNHLKIINSADADTEMPKIMYLRAQMFETEYLPNVSLQEANTFGIKIKQVILGNSYNRNEISLFLDIPLDVKTGGVAVSHQAAIENFTLFLQALFARDFAIKRDELGEHIVLFKKNRQPINERDINFVVSTLVSVGLVSESYSKKDLLNDCKIANENKANSQINNNNNNNNVQQVKEVQPDARNFEGSKVPLGEIGNQIQALPTFKLEQLFPNRGSSDVKPTILDVERYQFGDAIKIKLDLHGRNANSLNYLQEAFLDSSFRLSLDEAQDDNYLIISSNKRTPSSLDTDDIFQLCQFLKDQNILFSNNFDENTFFLKIEEINASGHAPVVNQRSNQNNQQAQAVEVPKQQPIKVSHHKKPKSTVVGFQPHSANCFKLKLNLNGNHLDLNGMQQTFKHSGFDLELENSALTCNLIISLQNNMLGNFTENEIGELSLLFKFFELEFCAEYSKQQFSHDMKQLQLCSTNQQVNNPNRMFNLKHEQVQQLEALRQQGQHVLANANLNNVSQSMNALDEEYYCPLSFVLMTDPVYIEVIGLNSDKQARVVAERQELENIIKNTGKHPWINNIKLKQHANDKEGYAYKLVSDKDLKAKIEAYNQSKATYIKK